jgi:signal peptidase
MTPTIPSESLVVVEPGRYHLGQPISFHQHGGIVTHRFVGTNADGSLITKGDANRTPDASSVKPGDVIGGVIAAPRYLGYWLMYFKSPLGFASLVIDILLIYQISMLFSDEDDEPAPKTALRPA